LNNPIFVIWLSEDFATVHVTTKHSQDKLKKWEFVGDVSRTDDSDRTGLPTRVLAVVSICPFTF
jgi:hypothetical protein